MPKIAIDYDNTQIYKLVHKDDLENENVYVGHTTNWTQRKGTHKSSCNNPNDKVYKRKVYQKIRDNGGWDEWRMIWLEDHPCGGKPEACARERYWIEYYKSNLNKVKPGRTREQWIQDNQEKIRESEREYRKNHIGKIKEYREDNTEKFKEYHKEYYQKNKEDIKKRQQNNYDTEKSKEYNKEYREKNSERLKDKYFNGQIICDKCSSVVKSHITRHKRTKKCMNFIPE